MSDLIINMKQVKVDNWGIYFLQRLKHFFNRTDYCDLTLQFQDNAQLKVHRLVLNACTEYFELLERTCEMYEDCLIMPEDLQADVVVPIVNFMYTGQLEFKAELLDKLLQTSQIMNMSVLSKLLDAQRNQKISKPPKPSPVIAPQSKNSYKSPASKRPYSKAFDTPKLHEHKTVYIPSKEVPTISTMEYLNAPKYKPKSRSQITETVVVQRKPNILRKPAESEPRPTRYEVPEELDADSIYSDSFLNISYESKPLMIHPDSKRPERKTIQSDFLPLFSEPSSSRKYMAGSSTHDMVECRKISKNTNRDSLFDETDYSDSIFDSSADIVQPVFKRESKKQFDQVYESNSGPKVTIEAKDAKQAANVDHAKIISEVLKKYPHLVNSNKNIKLKILETPNKTDKKLAKKHHEPGMFSDRVPKVKKEPGVDTDTAECSTYEDVIDSQAAAKLIAMGADNVKGPWICLICGTPGKALHFPSYFNFRRHLVEVHNEKVIPNVCEYCGLKSGKRNYLLHHLYTKHGIPPPPSYKFPKCNQCNYIALTEGFLVKHKVSHAENRDFRCNVCFTAFKTSKLLLQHIQATGHKYTADRKANLQCIYCLKVFLRENNLYAHLKTHHRLEAKRDGIVDDSDEEQEVILPIIEAQQVLPIKYEPESNPNYETEEDSNEMQYEIQTRPDGNYELTRSPQKQKILNNRFNIPAQRQPQKKVRTLNRSTNEEFTQQNASFSRPSHSNLNEEMMLIEQEFTEENEPDAEEYYIPSMEDEPAHALPNSNKESNKNINVQQQIAQTSKIAKKQSKVDQPIEIVMSNDEHELITPNHPVIFDSNGNPAKPFAVLTTLETAHSNEMMIIPDDYSLNVSEGDGKNSNFVVVYSHQLEDQNKQPYIVNPHYAQSQIITTQDLGTHFVQTSAVITPNYATVATTTPVITEQVVVPPPVMETFQETVIQVEENITEQESVDTPQLQKDPPQMQEAAIVEQENVIIVPNNENTNPNMAELDEMHILERDQATLQEIDHLPEVQLQSKEIDPHAQVPDEEQVILHKNKATEENSMEVEDSTNSIVQQIDSASHENNDQIESSRVASDTNEEPASVNDEETPEPEPPAVDEHVPQELSESFSQQDSVDNEEIQMETEPEATENVEVERAVESPTFTQVEEVTMQEEEEDTDQQATNTEEEEQPEAPEETTAQIQSLASEWSEDDEDITNKREDATNENVTAPEMEESIENIQQEMQKQVNEPEVESEESEVYAAQDIDPQVKVDETNVKEPTNGNVVPQEKISTLLNDWEDNDSQEVEAIANDSNEEIGNETGKNDASVNIEANPEEDNEQNSLEEAELDSPPKKVANIKSLVSDWDEEDEEKA